MNIINSYEKFKTSYLKSLAKTIYSYGDIDMLNTIVDRYVQNYFNAKIYSKFETIESSNFFDIEILRQEFDGLELELIDTYPNNIKEIKELKKVVFFICQLDRLYDNREELEMYLNNVIEQNNFIKILLGNKKSKFVKTFLIMSDKENRLFNTELDESYELNIVDEKKVKVVDLRFKIRFNISTYRKTLINQVYRDEGIYVKKVVNLLNKLSLLILKNKIKNIIDDQKYCVLVEDAAIEDGDFNRIIKDQLDNELIVQKVTIALSDDILQSRQKVYNNKVKLSCFRDVTYVNDLAKKFQGILSLPIEYFIVTDYKTKTKEVPFNFAKNDDRVVILGEEA